MSAACDYLERMARDALYAEAAVRFGPALERLARAYEPDAERRRDLLQEIHVALWRSFASFDGRCSVRTWVYRVAHNVATSQVTRRRANVPILVTLDELDTAPTADDLERALDQQRGLERLMTLVQRLKPLDRQIMLLYLEDLDAASIGEITGVSARNVATRVHRIKKLLAERFQQRGQYDH
jgi:RNA polymerase sigma-70 factor, ECF subfamily